MKLKNRRCGQRFGKAHEGGRFFVERRERLNCLNKIDRFDNE
jgi:hypothetical protein